MQWRNSGQRFGTIAAGFHWVIVAGLIAQYFLAEAGEESKDHVATAFDAMSVHRSIGWTILLLAILRLGWRFIDEHPRWPAGMKPYELTLAKLAHAIFYVLLFVLPISGWALSSAEGEPLRFFNLFAIPALPAQEAMEHTLEEVHEILFNVLLALAVLHIIAALKHQFVDRDGVLKSIAQRLVIDVAVRLERRNERYPYSRIVADLRDAGIAGLVVFGTTGEPATLNDREKRAIVECVMGASGAMPIVLGASGITADDVCEQVAAFDALPLAGALITAPYYVRPSQQAIIEFYEEIATRAHLAIIAYDIPYRTGIHMDLATLRTLARIPSVRAIKDCGGDVRKTQALIAARELSVLSGDDHLIFNTIAQGGAGAIAASAHLHPRLFVEMYRALNEGNLERARVLHHALAPLIEALSAEPSPAPLKAVLAKLDRARTGVRKPLLPASHAAAQRAWSEYSRVASSLQQLELSA